MIILNSTDNKNIFDIRVGVCVNLFVRHTEHSEVSKSRESKLWANQCHKSESKITSFGGLESRGLWGFYFLQKQKVTKTLARIRATRKFILFGYFATHIRADFIFFCGFIRFTFFDSPKLSESPLNI